MAKQLNPDQLRFILTNKDNLIGELGVTTVQEMARTIEGMEALTQKHFEHLMAVMLKSTDDNIRVELPRCLMSIGFDSVIADLAKATMRGIISGDIKMDSLEISPI